MKHLPNTIYGIYNEWGYRIFARQADGSDKELYAAGNCAFDSGQSLDPTVDTKAEVLPLETIRRYCTEQGQDLAKDKGTRYSKTIYDPIER